MLRRRRMISQIFPSAVKRFLPSKYFSRKSPSPFPLKKISCTRVAGAGQLKKTENDEEEWEIFFLPPPPPKSIVTFAATDVFW